MQNLIYLLKQFCTNLLIKAKLHSVLDTFSMFAILTFD